LIACILNVFKSSIYPIGALAEVLA
jgi:hypothetical protein